MQVIYSLKVLVNYSNWETCSIIHAAVDVSRSSFKTLTLFVILKAASCTHFTAVNVQCIRVYLIFRSLCFFLQTNHGHKVANMAMGTIISLVPEVPSLETIKINWFPCQLNYWIRPGSIIFTKNKLLKISFNWTEKNAKLNHSFRIYNGEKIYRRSMFIMSKLSKLSFGILMEISEREPGPITNEASVHQWPVKPFSLGNQCHPPSPPL